MDARRLFLYIALGLIVMLLWTTWQHDHPPSPRQQSRIPVSQPQGQAAVSAHGPAPQESTTAVAPTAGARLRAPSGPTVTIETNVLSLTVSLHGAVITQADLLKYPQHVGSKAVVKLLSTGGNGSRFLVAQSELSGPDVPRSLDYTSTAKHYTLQSGQDVLRVPLSWTGNGLRVERVLVLHRDSYQLEWETRIRNTTIHPERVSVGMRLVGANPIAASHIWDHFLPKYWAYRGPAYYDGSYEKKPARSLAGSPLSKSISGGWIASVQQYFVAAAIPPKRVRGQYYAHAVEGGGYDIGYQQPALHVAAGATAATTTTLFLGPKKQNILGTIAPGLSRTVDYGKATIISVPLFWVLSHIHGVVGNWGWSIFLLVLLIKAVFYWPQRVSARSMAKMRQLQPRLKLLQETYKDDRQKLSQATMELYRKEGANPVSGCLPMLIQIPIWIGLFEMLIHSVELRQAPWVLWIRNLTAPDPYFILPAIYAVLTLIQFRLQPQTATGPQAKMMMLMPLMFSAFYAILPSGLVLYYLLNTFLTIAIQYQVNRELGMQGLGILPDWLRRRKGKA